MRPFIVFLVLMLSCTLVAQKSTLANLLWEEVGGRIDVSEGHGGHYEITDDAANGYLKVAFTEDGCGCYSETTVGAYKNDTGSYTTLKMYWDGCGNRKKLSSNKNLDDVLPKGFGLSEFSPVVSNSTFAKLNAIFYLEAEIPQKGTETALQLKYVPFGIDQQGDSRVLSKQGYNLSNSKHTQIDHYEDVMALFNKFQNPQTMDCLLNGDLQSIALEDREQIGLLFGEGKKYERYDILFAIVARLNNYFKMASTIEYKTVILDWNREKARFFVKEQIKNDAPQMSFLAFVQQLPFVVAVC